MNEATKKHPCQDCCQCQWCNNERCRLCLKPTAPPRLSIPEQIALYERLNGTSGCAQEHDNSRKSLSQDGVNRPALFS